VPVVTPPAAPNAGQVTGVTDPRIIRQGDTYYVFSTGPGIPIRASNDLTHWREIGQVFATVPAWALAEVPGATSIWAPDVSYFNGQYHLYYAISTFGSQRSVIGLATNRTLDPSAPAYQWVDQGEVIGSAPGQTNFNAIDPNLVIDPRSGLWLAFGSQWSGIKLLKIDPATGKRQNPSLGLVSLASRPGGAPIEAPFVFERGGYNYLFVSFGTCCMGVNSTYKIMVGRSRSVTGPYLDRIGRPMTAGGGTLVLAGNARYHGPGHNAVLSDGGTDYLVYSAADALNQGASTLQVRPLFWTPSGWPVVGKPLF
jgi:arabinan endo-1,5-alpha-L-arabinosidase